MRLEHLLLAVAAVFKVQVNLDLGALAHSSLGKGAFLGVRFGLGTQERGMMHALDVALILQAGYFLE